MKRWLVRRYLKAIRRNREQRDRIETLEDLNQLLWDELRARDAR